MQKIKTLCIATWKQWRAISIVYLVQLLLGLVVSFSFYSEISTHMGMSMALDQLANGFDRTVFMDLINSNNATLFTTTKMLGIWMLVLYLLIGVFLQAGWLANIRKKEFTISSLLSHSMQLIGPFLGLALISVFLVVFIGGLVGFIFTITVGDPLVTFSSEKPYVIWIVCLAALFIFWSISIWSWSVISRYYYIDGNTFWASLKLGWHAIRKKWFKFQAIGMLIVAIHVLFMFLYYWLMGDRGAPSWFIVLIGVFIQQVLNLLRIALRGFGYSLVEDLV